MSHELRAIALMLEALRFEVRGAGVGLHPEFVTETWQLADEMAQAAEKELQHAKQETEAGIREQWGYSTVAP